MLMKRINLFWLTIFLIIFFNSCQERSIKLISKKWDCVKVENFLPSDLQITNAKDSANALQLQSMLQSLSWTFSDNMEYECAVNGRAITHGTYGLRDNETVLLCTPDTKNNVNRYIIQTLTEDGLVLRGSTTGIPLTLHFKPH